MSKQAPKGPRGRGYNAGMAAHRRRMEGVARPTGLDAGRGHAELCGGIWESQTEVGKAEVCSH